MLSFQALAHAGHAATRTSGARSARSNHGIGSLPNIRVPTGCESRMLIAFRSWLLIVKTWGSYHKDRWFRWVFGADPMGGSPTENAEIYRCSNGAWKDTCLKSTEGHSFRVYAGSSSRVGFLEPCAHCRCASQLHLCRSSRNHIPLPPGDPLLCARGVTP